MVSIGMNKRTNNEFVKFAKGLKTWVVGILTRTWNWSDIWREAIGDCAS